MEVLSKSSFTAFFHLDRRDNYYYYYEDGHLSYYISSFVTTASVLGLAMSIKLLKNQIIQTEEKQELIEEKNKVELQALTLLKR